MIKTMTACMLTLAFNLIALTPSEGFEQLAEGNIRFRTNQSKQLKNNRQRRAASSDSQNPFAIIVACSDSRVSPEILFDQGIGELFVVRVAGNVIGPLQMESIEYAAKYLGASCILVMGHENCGAVDAVVKGDITDIRYISQLINKSVKKAKAARSRNVLKTAIKFNAQASSRFIEQSTIISELMEDGDIEVQSAYYDFDTGKVEML